MFKVIICAIYTFIAELNSFHIFHYTIDNKTLFVTADEKQVDKFLPFKPEHILFLEQVTVINENLTVTANDPDFKDLRPLRHLLSVNYLIIANSSLQFLNLLELKTIRSGVIIEHNRNLCVNRSKEFWRDILQNTEGVLRINDNKPEEECDLSCDVECDVTMGCWGPGSDQCRKCRHLAARDSGQCVTMCNETTHYELEGECWPCDTACLEGCNRDWERCPNCEPLVRIKPLSKRPYCDTECKYNQFLRDGTCERCRDYCFPFGCSGPLNTDGDGGCRVCPKPLAMFDKDLWSKESCYTNFCLKIKDCLQLNETCPLGYFQDIVPDDVSEEYRLDPGSLLCVKCHTFCLECTGYGFRTNGVCQKCVALFPNCSCPRGEHYDAEEDNCVPCVPGCEECSGPEYCEMCSDDHFRVYDSGLPGGSFVCMEECPPQQPYTFYNDEFHQNYCSVFEHLLSDSDNDYVVENIPLAITTIVSLTLLCIYVPLRRKANSYKEEMQIDKILGRSDVSNELTGVTPETVRSINDTDIKKTKMLASGKFSTVYKGILFYNGKKIKVPVAIKILKPEVRCTTEETLKEAHFVGSLHHPNILRLLAIGTFSSVTLITEFISLGNMFYLLRNKNTEIKHNTLISWCKQIAEGLAFLEENGLVHKHLAARKVLVETTNRVKIIYFGLEKCFDIDQDIHVPNSGNHPIKWRALESLKHGMFSHKSDVWSFGVTVWEILTYGEEPCLDSSLPELLIGLENGKRLPQPDSCSADMYTVMVSCWTEDASARPSFQELVQTFSRIARDSGRFLQVSRKASKQGNESSKGNVGRNKVIQNLGEVFHDYVNINPDEATYENISSIPQTAIIPPVYANQSRDKPSNSRDEPQIPSTSKSSLLTETHEYMN